MSDAKDCGPDTGLLEVDLALSGVGGLIVFSKEWMDAIPGPAVWLSASSVLLAFLSGSTHLLLYLSARVSRSNPAFPLHVTHRKVSYLLLAAGWVCLYLALAYLLLSRIAV